MAVTPHTELRLIKCPLELDNNNQINFSSKNSQEEYFTSLQYEEVDNFTYQRHDSIIRYPAHIDTLLEYNYCMYKNNNYSEKWFYAFITGMRYVNDNLTEISIKTDVFQTWQFDITYKHSFVEREHVNSDIIGEHTVPENVELGEYISNGFDRDNELSELATIIQVSEWSGGSENKPLATNYGGIWSTGGAYVVTDIQTAINIIQLYQNGREDAILNVYTVPKKIINHDFSSFPYNAQFKGQSSPITYDKSITKPTTLDGYSPINNKLLTYPYQYLVLDNNNGSSNILQYELFSTNTCDFEIEGVPTVGASIKCVPLHYKGESRYQQEGIMCGKFPTLSWSNDPYTNWLTQNSVNIGVGIVSSGLQIIGGIGLLATGGGAIAGASALTSGSLGVAQSIGQIYQHSLIPNSARGNINGGDINTCYDMNKFYFIKMSIKREYAKIIDDYFSMYGYKINKVKTPNITSRQNWNYIKTIGINLEGYLPQSDLEELKNLFNRGITIWHNPNNFLNYNSNNNIV